jgi:hypothetical protein
MELDDIFYAAITGESSLVSLTDGNIVTCCFEVPPDIEDNTPLPYIIIVEDPNTNEQGTKDDVWDSDIDSAQVSIEIAATTKAEVKQLRRKVRKAIREYVSNMDYTARPDLRSFSNEGIAWDWLKPCYYDRLHYQCDVIITEDEDDEQDED